MINNLKTRKTFFGGSLSHLPKPMLAMALSKLSYDNEVTTLCQLEIYVLKDLKI